jgi:hypothetical protein
MSLLLNTPSTYRKHGIYYLQRYNSKDARQHYKTTRISFSLGTKSAREAIALARTASTKLETYRHSLKLAYAEVHAQHLMSFRGKNSGKHPAIAEPVDLSLTESGEMNLRLKGVKQDQDIPQCCIAAGRLCHESNRE